MYNFIDVNEVSEESILPSEALSINGAFIEDQISGYRTLNVTGREALSPDVVTYTTGIRDGSKIKSKRYPERIITVAYQLTAATNEAFREAYNKLGQILNVQDAELIFNDELDKFFIGTPCIIDPVTPGRNSVVGEFEIVCADPFKYSVMEYEAEPNIEDGSVVLNYNGTYKAHPTLEATFFNEEEVANDGETAKALTGAGDCGYVAFFNADEKIIQLGDPDEVEGIADAYPKSQTMMNQTFKDSTSWGTTAKKLWAVNSGVIPAEVQQLGSVAMGYATYSSTTSSGMTSGSLGVFSGTPSYGLTYSTKNRTANSVEVVVAVSAKSTGGFAAAAVVKAVITIGGTSHTIVVKNGGAAVAKNTSVSSSKSIKITGLSSSQTSITGVKFSAMLTFGGSTATTHSNMDCNDIKISTYSSTTYATYYINASDYGSASGKWHGPSITRTIGADESGEVGAANFTLTYEQKMCIGNTTAGQNQMGGFHCHLSDASGKVVAGVRIVKTKAGRSASLMLFVNGQKLHQVGIDMSYYNQYFGASTKSVNTSTIRKSGSTVYFNIGGYSQTFTDSAIANMKVTKVTFMFEKYSTTAALSYNGLYWAKFVKDNCNTYKDVPNKFSANDVVVADCKNAEIYLNGIHSPNLGALGNDWEGFVLKPGLNEIGFSYSSWVSAEYAPSFKVCYREVFL